MGWFVLDFSNIAEHGIERTCDESPSAGRFRWQFQCGHTARVEHADDDRKPHYLLLLLARSLCRVHQAIMWLDTYRSRFGRQSVVHRFLRAPFPSRGGDHPSLELPFPIMSQRLMRSTRAPTCPSVESPRQLADNALASGAHRAVAGGYVAATAMLALTTAYPCAVASATGEISSEPPSGQALDANPEHCHACLDDFPVLLFRDNYLLFGHDSSDLNRGFVAKFQLSIRLRLVFSDLYFGFTQRSFMDLLADSRPFFDHNFAPELRYRWQLPKTWAQKALVRWIAISVNHESNGRSGPASRSWNRVIFETRLAVAGAYAGLALWLPFALEDTNSNIAEYYGYGELTLGYRLANGAEFSGNARVGRWRGYLRGDVTLPLRLLPGLGWLTVQTSLWLQLRYGFGETLIGYDRKATSVACGLGFRPRFP